MNIEKVKNPLRKIREELGQLGNPEKAEVSARFFKTGKGQYGYGDKFLGITVPEQRAIAKRYCDLLSFPDLCQLLKSKIHEERLTALLTLVLRYKKADTGKQKKIFDFYFANVVGINNWDLVDLSAPYIVGQHLLDKNKDILFKLVKSKSLWDRRIAIVATWFFIRNSIYKETLKLAKSLLHDDEDLIHKAVGWMLREVGKKDSDVLNKFLVKYYKIMPRTMLRYAIERFPEKLRLSYLHGTV